MAAVDWHLRFVDSTTASRVTRLDLNNAAASPSIELDDYNGEPNPDFGEASVERTLTDPEGRDGQVVTASKRSNREVVIPLVIHGTTAEFATAMRAIARECDRAKNYLEWKPDGASPVFFVVRQGSVSNPAVDKAAVNVWTCELTLLCDPAALGVEETGSVTVHNDPQFAPNFTNLTTSTTGGTLGNSVTRFYVVTATTAQGETARSNERSVTTGASGGTHSNTLTWAAATGATGYKIYRSATTGTETLLATVGAVTTYTDTGSAAGTATPPANSVNSGLAQGFTLPAVKGDIPAPLNMELTGATLSTAGATLLVNAHTADTTSDVFFVQAENGSAIVDTGLQASTAAMSGTGTNDAMRCTFATDATMNGRVLFLNVDVAFGNYKVLVRVRKTTATNTFQLRYDMDVGNTNVTGSTVTYPATFDVGPHWLDLGVLSVPLGAPPPGVTSGIVGDLVIEAARTAGTGSLDFDCVKLVPVDVPGAPEVTTAFVWQQFGGSATEVLGLNADEDAVWTKNTTVYGTTATRVAGSLPMVHPGYDNHLAVMRHVGTVGGGTNNSVPADDIAWSTTLTWKYNPRYLFVAAP